MAERISSLPEPNVGRPPLYPWDEWTDGSVWRIRRGEDFDTSVKGMTVNLHSTAARRGLDVSVRVDGEAIDFQFTSCVEAAA